MDIMTKIVIGSVVFFIIGVVADAISRKQEQAKAIQLEEHKQDKQ